MATAELLNLGVGVTRAQKNLLEAWSRKQAQGQWQPGEFIGSDLALSEQFGVSRTVVRGALEILEQQQLVRRILRHGFVLERNFSLDSGKETAPSHGELFFIRWFEDALILDILTGLQEQAQRRGFSVLQGSAHLSESLLIEMLDHLPESCRNLVMLPFETPEVIAAMHRALKRGVRIVQLDRYIENFPAPSVVCDNFCGGILATRHLLEQHDGPVYFWGNSDAVSSRKRFLGWRDTMHDAGYLQLDQYVIPHPKDLRAEVRLPEEVHAVCREYLHEFLKQASSPMSIFAVSDSWALQVYQVAKELNLQIGKDIFLVGFDDLELCRRLTPTLTSIAVPRKQFGVEAVELLAEEPGKLTGYCKILPVELKVRDSSILR